MIDKIIFYAVINITVSIAIFYLYKGGEKNINLVKEDAHTLKMNKLFYYLGILLIIVGVSTIIIPLFSLSFSENNNQIIAMSIMGSLCILMGMVLIKIYKTHFLIFDDHTVSVVRYFGKITQGKLEDIETVKFNSLTGMITIRLKTGFILKFSQYLVGITNFIQHIETKNQLDLKKVKLKINPFTKSSD